MSALTVRCPNSQLWARKTRFGFEVDEVGQMTIERCTFQCEVCHEFHEISGEYKDGRWEWVEVK